jgi:hypothetical protein
MISGRTICFQNQAGSLLQPVRPMVLKTSSHRKNKKAAGRPCGFAADSWQLNVCSPPTMSFHFKRAEPLERAVRRVCRQHIGVALIHLRRSKHSAAVHGVRKEIKMLRAIFRLVRGEISLDVYRKTMKALRRTARLLAAPRDARVMLKAFEKLTGPAAARRFPKVQRLLQAYCRQEARRFRNDDSFDKAKSNLRKIKRRVAGLKIKTDGWPAIEPGLRQSFLRGRRDCESVRTQPSPGKFHQWRKQVRIFLCHLQVLCPAWPAAAYPMMKELNQVGKLLGDDHDLVLLKKFVASRGDGLAAEAKLLNQLIESRQKELRQTALKFGVRLYAETPAAVCARLKNHWHNWQDD